MTVTVRLFMKKFFKQFLVLTNVVFFASLVVVFFFNQSNLSEIYHSSTFHTAAASNEQNRVTVKQIAKQNKQEQNEKKDKKDAVIELTGYNCWETKDIINVLLIGIDYNDTENKRGNTDSMIIASVNKMDHSIKLVSIMRDTYVTLPGYGGRKLNSVYNCGGITLLSHTIEDLFGIPLDGYFMVDFDLFRHIIDEMGGVKLTLTEDEAEYIRTSPKVRYKAKKLKHVKSGKHVYNGTQALAYARIRGIGNDFERTNRQRKVLIACYNKFKKASLTDQIGITKKIFEEIQTSVTLDTILYLLMDFNNFKVDEIQTMRIPEDGTFKNNRSLNDSLEVDYETNKKDALRFLYAKE